VSFRTKLLAFFTINVVLTVGLVAWTVSASMRAAFERLDSQRTAALVEQFRREFARRRQEVTQPVEGIAEANDTSRIAVALNRPAPDYSAFVNEATGLAAAHQLDFLELVSNDGNIVSSAQWPARFGYQEAWVTSPIDWVAQGPFLKREELADGEALALIAVRVVSVGDKKLYVVGGRRLGREFLSSMVFPEGMRALLYQDAGPGPGGASIVNASGPILHSEKLRPLIARALSASGGASSIIQWTDDPTSAEAFQVIPLTGRNKEVLGMFLVGRSRREQIELERHIRSVAVMVGGAGIVLGILLSGWAAGRVTKPVRQLAEASRRVAGGNWDVRVESTSADELGQLAQAFNQMTQQLLEQRDRLVQAERVAAWRELARRLAHELKNPLFPLQITVENLLRARESHAGEFDEVFRESTATLLAELSNLRMIVGRFSDFAKMPAPHLQPVDINEIVRGALKLFDAQLHAPGKQPIVTEVDIDTTLKPVQADPDLLHRAIQNLILNALDVMPSGGKLTLRTRANAEGVRLEVSDTGKGLTREECERLFTPYYTTKQHGTGLGLAIVQSVVSDHGGKISVESEPERGTRFTIDLPANAPAAASGEEGAQVLEPKS
jgi:two-component system nitrogen regulation sensor histidine kinase NtrY